MVLAVLLGLSLAAVSQAPTTTRASEAPGAIPGNAVSEYPAISGDGRFVAFRSDADNLVPGDLNGKKDIFVHDRLTGIIERASVGTGGIEANGSSYGPRLSRDGRFVVFVSSATNLASGDFNGEEDGFVHDRWTGVTAVFTVSPGGSLGNGSCDTPTISADGTMVAFGSNASNLVVGDTNQVMDVFVRDLAAGVTTRISVGPGGVQADDASFQAAISADGTTVTFKSHATNLVVGDTNGVGDVFVHDRATRTTTMVSVSSSGAPGNRSSGAPSISGDGRLVAFDSWASDLVPGDSNGWQDVFVHDLVSGMTSRISMGPGGVEGDGSSVDPRISEDGRSVGFWSSATNLVAGDTNGVEDCFLHDLSAGTLQRVSVDGSGGQGNDGADSVSLSRDGRSAAFRSDATNLVPGDFNGASDVFVRALAPVMNVEGLTPGGTATLRFALAEPGALLYPGLSTGGPGPALTGLGFEVDLGFPITLLPPVTADAAGAASAVLPVPANAPPGRTVWWHGVERVGAAFRPTTALATVIE